MAMAEGGGTTRLHDDGVTGLALQWPRWAKEGKEWSMKPFLESARCGEARDKLTIVRSMRLRLVLGDGVSRVRTRGFGGGVGCGVDRWCSRGPFICQGREEEAVRGVKTRRRRWVFIASVTRR
jgi:hypothetical protein